MSDSKIVYANSVVIHDWIDSVTRCESEQRHRSSTDLCFKAERIYFRGIHIASLYRTHPARWGLFISQRTTFFSDPSCTIEVQAPTTELQSIAYSRLRSMIDIFHTSDLTSRDSALHGACEIKVRTIARIIDALGKSRWRNDKSSRRRRGDIKWLTYTLRQYDIPAKLLSPPPSFPLVDDILMRVWPVKTLHKIAPDAAYELDIPQEVFDFVKREYPFLSSNDGVIV